MRSNVEHRAGRNRVRRALALIALGLALGATPGLAPLGEDPAEAAEAQPKVLVRTTGDNTERRNTIPITRRSGAKKRVVASMSPRTLPSLREQDGVEATAEVQVTADCRERVRRCAGRPYNYNPIVNARLILADSARGTSGPAARAISDRQRIRCRQRRPARTHHCVIVFTDAAFSHSQANDLGCAPDACRVNLVLDAHSRRASGGGREKLVIGGNAPDGTIRQDKARINAIRFRPGAQPRIPPEVTSRRRTRRLPMTSTDNVVYSQRLDDLRAREQLVVDSRMRTEIDHLPYGVRVNSQLVLTDGRQETRPGRRVRRVASLSGAISEANGFNCVQPEAPCLSEKVGVLTMGRDVDRPLYVNLVLNNSAKLQAPKGGDTAKVARGGRLRVVRYPPVLRG